MKYAVENVSKEGNMRKLVRNKVIGLLLATSMALTGFAMPTNAKATETKPLKTWEGHGLGKTHSADELKTVQEMGAKKLSGSKASYPSSYDLRKSKRVTSVKNQGDYGLCWCFAAMSSMESNALTKKLGEYDLSETHMAYFAFNNIYNPRKGLEGDRVYYQASEPWYNRGGSSMVSTFLVAKGYGPVAEEDAPYSAIPSMPSEDTAYGKNQLAVEDVYWMLGSDRNAMKKAISENGAIVVGVAMVGDPLVYNEKKDALFISKDLYEQYELITDHDISVIGWDDNYSKNNFGESKPSKNGAWLCKNSWGSDWGNHDGYFWLSYEDAPSRDDFAFSYVVGEKEEYDDIYQHDGGAGLANLKAKGLRATNVFTARENTSIISVGNFMETGSGTVKIYTGLTNEAPETGKLVASKSFKQTGLAAWSSIKLDKPVEVKNGEKFAIVYQFNGGATLFVDADTDPNSRVYYDISAAQGESLVDVGQGWQYLGGANLRIKAYTKANILNIQNAGSGKVSMSWSPVDYASGYEVYRKAGNEEYSLIATLEADVLSYVDNDAEIGEKYTYKVVPTGLYGEAPEYCASIKTILSKPTGLALSKSKKAVTVKWKSVDKASKYEIYRKLGSGSFKKIATVGKTTSYKDNTVKKGKTYTYKVVAVAANKVKSAASSTKKIKF